VARISPETVTAVEQATDIVSLVSEYIPLKRAGKDFKGLCPFHNEKTPSFFVVPAKQIYHCFGCGEGGNAFGFVMAMEKVSFPEAVIMLAEKAGIKVEQGEEQQTGGIDKEKLYRANEWATKEYEKHLWDDSRGAPAREYLSGRGLGVEIAKRFRLGYAPPSRDTLLRALGRRSKSTEAVLEAAGLITGRDRGEPYDRFRGRLMFPIMDARGRVIAFGGRTLGDDTPKYLNSPETPIFSKGISLYAISFAKQAALKAREIFVMEGYTDVLAAFQCGVETAVATLGTALTAQHVRNLRRYADRVYLVYDGDFAGEKASDRGLDIFLEEEVDAAIFSLPAGEDPCDFLLKRGGEEFLSLKGAAREIFEYKVALASRKHDLGTIAGQTRALEEILTTVAKVPTAMRQELYLARNTVLRDLSERMNVPESVLRERVKRLKTGRAQEVAGKDVKYPTEEKWLLESILAEPNLVEAAAARVSPDEFRHEDLKRMLRAVYDVFQREGEVRVASVVTAMEDLGGLVVTLAENGSKQLHHERRVADCIEKILDRKKRETRVRLKRELTEEAGKGDSEKADELLRKYQEGM
jgi:DNA primase